MVEKLFGELAASEVGLSEYTVALTGTLDFALFAFYLAVRKDKLFELVKQELSMIRVKAES